MEQETHMPDGAPCIYVKGARVNNLKNVTLRIPRDRFVVVTGLSGSGKSSLAFDTLYAEGQRRYVESLTSYARQFLGRMGKPECDYILGIPPAVAIQQKVITRNPRSTVGTVTEIYDYLRLLYARVGRTVSPVSGTEVRKHTVADVVQAAEALPEGTRVALVTVARVPEGRSVAEHSDLLRKSGFARAEREGQFVRLEELPEEARTFHLVVDRLKVPLADAAAQARLADSVETAFYEGDGECLLLAWTPDGGQRTLTFSKRFEADGMTFEEPTEMMFNFNSPAGACPTCEGFGQVLGIDPDLVIPNPSLSVAQDCVVCWKGEKMSEWKHYFIKQHAPLGFPVHTPYYRLTAEQKDMLWHGVWRQGEGEEEEATIDGFFRFLTRNQYKIQYRVMQARYRGKTVCPACHGARLRAEAGYVQVGGRTIAELVRMPVAQLIPFFATLRLDDTEAAIARRLLAEIRSRLDFLAEVGLSYLTLDRRSNTLSGGESQRIHLATSLGSALVGSMYVLDEPSIGLHPRDTDRLIRVLRRLRDLGNTVIVVEHDEEIIRAADYLIDIGPEAGRYGGEVVYAGPTALLGQGDGDAAARSHTAQFLTGADAILLPVGRRPWQRAIAVCGAVHHNLQDITVRFPLGVLTVVTGPSGSGKSTLVRELLYKGMLRYLGLPGDAPGAFSGLDGDLDAIDHIEFVDQNPIGKSTRSNAATYLKAYDEIRRVYADQPLARQLGMTAATFSFNVEGGRCEECKGDGVIHIEMQFMSDLVLPCEACHGKRFKSDVLEVKYRGKDIAEVLDLSVDEAIEFFADEPRVVQRLRPLQRVGLGYIKLGQSSSTLSGGENQRVKLASYLVDSPARNDVAAEAGHTLFIFDEPTTGLHLHDVRVLLQALGALIERGHTVVVIEHNLDVIKCADHIIDLGPEGGDQGGHLVFEGMPEALCRVKQSYTAQYLAPKMPRRRGQRTP